MPVKRLTKRVIDAAPPMGSTYLVRDSELKGFVLAVTPQGSKSYAVEYRIGYGRGAPKRRLTIGKHGSPWTAETARTEAFRVLGDVAKGIDPLAVKDDIRNAMTVGELCDAYLREGTAHKKPSTLRGDRSRIEHHIKPNLGKKLVVKVERADVERLLNDVSLGRNISKIGARKAGSVLTGGRGVAAQCVTLLSTLFAFAIKRGIRSQNPAQGIKKPAVRKLNRFLSDGEFTTLAVALRDEHEATNNPFPVAAIMLLLMTGCRKNEILGLRWTEVDFENRLLRLPDSKTGAKIVYLNTLAVTILTNLPREAQNPLVIGGSKKGFGQVAIDKVWSRVRKAAHLDDVRLHDLRHSFASVGVRNGLNLPVLGALLGHKHTITTARYAHLSDDPIREAAERIGLQISGAMKGKATLTE